MSFNVAIDGPAGAGKSTIAKRAAALLSYIYVDTGAMYRAIALYMLREGIDIQNEKAVTEACRQLSVTIAYEGGDQQVLLNQENVTGSIRCEEVGNAASTVSAYQAVRQKLTELQKEMAASKDVVMDGRDIGTAVLPSAQVKIYLTASAHIRALRRQKELEGKGVKKPLDEIEADIIERDQRDMSREISPLCQAKDAYYLDSSNMDINEVVEKIMELCKEKIS